jgi:ribonuclease G
MEEYTIQQTNKMVLWNEYLFTHYHHVLVLTTISSTLILEDEISKNLNYLIMQRHKGLSIEVHPIIYSYLTCGFISRRLKWSWKYKQNIKIKSNNSYHLTEFKFFDNNEEEIKL